MEQSNDFWLTAMKLFRERLKNAVLKLYYILPVEIMEISSLEQTIYKIGSSE